MSLYIHHINMRTKATLVLITPRESVVRTTGRSLHLRFSWKTSGKQLYCQTYSWWYHPKYKLSVKDEIYYNFDDEGNNNDLYEFEKLILMTNNDVSVHLK